MKILEFDQGSPEWFEWRLKRATASNSAAVIGQDKHKTPYDVWSELTLRTQGFAGNKFTEAGKLMEPKARACYEIEHDFADMRPVCIEHELHPEIGASLDGLRFPDHKIILEIKYPGEESHSIAQAGKVPDHYIPQVQHQLMCAPEVEELHYWSFRDDKGVKVVVKHDYAFQIMLTGALLAFMELVRKDIPPPLTPDDVKIIEGHEEIISICTDISTAKDKMSKQELDDMKARAVSLAGHPKMRCGNIQISSVNRNGKFSYHKLTIRGAG